MHPQQPNGFAEKVHRGIEWVGGLLTLPDVGFGVLYNPCLGRLETVVHATTVGVVLWNGEAHRSSIVLSGSEIEVIEGLGQ